MTERIAVMEDVDFAPAKAKKPAPQWRNRYTIGGVCVTFNDEQEFEDRYYPPGEYFWPVSELLRSEWIEAENCDLR